MSRPLDPCAAPDAQPLTLRKLRNRGLEPVRYHSEDEFRHGWLVEVAAGFTRVQLIGEERVRKIHGTDRRYIRPLEEKSQ